MKLATFDVSGPRGVESVIGALVDSHLVDLRAAYADALLEEGWSARAETVADAILGRTMIEFLEGGAHSRAAAERAVEHVAGLTAGVASSLGQQMVYGLEEVRLRAPVPRPTNLRDFTGYRLHLEEFIAQTDLPDATAEIFSERPMFYKANPNLVLGPDDKVPWSGLTERLDFEVEIVAVIGRAGMDVAPGDAAAHIAGYTILNDFSLRDYQVKEMSVPVNLYGLSKAKDAGHYPMGPWMVTTDELDPGKLDMVVRVNGEEWVRETTSDSTWTFADIVSFSSTSEPIVPGDCLAGGAPPRGCGADIDRWIEPGDTVECEVPGIGVLTNVVGDRP